MIKRTLLLLFLCSAAFAEQDLTTWTERDDREHLTVTATSITVDAMTADETAYVAKTETVDDDFDVRFRFEPGAVSHADGTGFLGVLSLSTLADNFYRVRSQSGSCVTVVYNRAAGGYRIFLWITGTQLVWAVSQQDLYVSTGTNYYGHLVYQYEGGANGTGAYTLYVSTGNYYGLAGASLVGTETVDAPASCPTDWSYILAAQSRDDDQPTSTASGVIANIDFGPFELAKATDPSPAHQATDVETDAVLSWAEVADANDYDVYFGVSTTDINSLSQGNTDANTYDPGTLDYSTEYHWRIDANDPNGTTTGDVWTFTTEEEEEEEEEEEPPRVQEPVTGWQRSPVWNKTPQWQKSPPVWEVFTR